MSVEGLGSRALAGRSGVEQKAADFDQLGMQVNPENMLGIYAAIASQVARLHASAGGQRIVGGFDVSESDRLTEAGDVLVDWPQPG